MPQPTAWQPPERPQAPAADPMFMPAPAWVEPAFGGLSAKIGELAAAMGGSRGQEYEMVDPGVKVHLPFGGMSQ